MITLWRKFWFRLKDEISPEAAMKTAELAKEALEKAKEGLEVHYVGGPESVATLNLAQAASALIQSLAGVENAAIRTGPLLLCKCTTNGVARIAVETVSPRLRKILDENPGLLESPTELFQLLQKQKDGVDVKDLE